MYTDILFDMDDTLLDFQKAQFYGFSKVLEYYGEKFTPEKYKVYERINHSLWSEFEKKTISKDEVQNSRFALYFRTIKREIDGFEANSLYQDYLSEQVWLMPHALEVCRTLSKNHTLSIITNGVGVTQMKRFNLSEIAPYISHIIISESIGVAKPDKKFFELAFDMIGCKKENVLVVGDSLSSDIRGANNVGVDCCLFNPSKAIYEDEKDFSINYTIDDLRQLIMITGRN